MTCDTVRMLLAAYRRSEWSDEDQHLVNAHLVSCADCRQWEAQARGVGEHLRALPTIVPPPSLRANVFAIIRQEELARATQAAETARPAPAVPQPPTALPVPPRPVILTRPTHLPARPTVAAPPTRIGEVAIGKTRPPRIVFGRATAIATIAAAFVVLFAVQLIPLFNVHVNPGYVVVAYNPAPVKAASFIAAPDPAFANKVSSPYANLKALFFVGQSVDGKSMLYSQDRYTGQSKALLAQPTTDTIHILGLSDGLLLWQATAGTDWTVQGLALTDGAPSADAIPQIYAASGQGFGNSTLDKLTSYWVDGQNVLFTALDTHGATILERADGTSSGIVYTFLSEALPGHVITSPYLDGDHAYWVDRVAASDGTQVGTLWSAVGAAKPQAIALAGNTIGPVAQGDSLAWFQPSPATTPSSASVDSGLLPTLTGSIMTRDTATGQIRTLSTVPVQVTDVVRGSGYIAWSDGKGQHVYRLDTKEVQDNKIPAATPALGTLDISASSAAWSTVTTQGATGATTILVADLII